MQDSASQKKGGLTPRKIVSYVVLFAMVVILLLILKKPMPVAEPMAPSAAKERSDEVQTKMAELETAHQRGEPAEARFSSEQINGVLQQAQTELAQAEKSATPAAHSEVGKQASSQETEPLPEITTTQVAFEGDQAKGQFLVHGPGGKDIYLTIAGKIKAVNGYASFEFTEGKIGDMPVPVGLLNARLQAKLQDPETRPKLKLPEYVADIRVENSQLVMTEK